MTPAPVGNRTARTQRTTELGVLRLSVLSRNAQRTLLPALPSPGMYTALRESRLWSEMRLLRRLTAVTDTPYRTARLVGLSPRATSCRDTKWPSVAVCNVVMPAVRMRCVAGIEEMEKVCRQQQGQRRVGLSWGDR